MTCTNCGAELPADARFCPRCGAPATGLVETDERKMVTVLFADLVDSTGLSRRLDPERARDVLGAFFDAASTELRALRGQPEKFIGDAVMAVFGLPQVNEDDALRAVRAGLAIRQRTRRLGRSLGLPQTLDIHVGIESGEAATGRGPDGQMLVTGAVVNAAARLESAAGAGEVLVGEVAHALTVASVSFGDPTVVPAKGFEEAELRAYPVRGLMRRSVRRTIPLVGRQFELTMLRDAQVRAAGAGRPHLFTVQGEPGIGKSRLLQEFVAGLDRDVKVLEGRAEAHGGRATFIPVGQMLQHLAGIGEDDPPDVVRRALEETVQGCCDPSETQRVAARLALSLGIGLEGRDESSFVQEAQGGFLTLVEGLTARGPVVLVFDDIHMARAPLLDLVERLVARARHGPSRLLVVAAGRPDLLEARPGWGGNAVNHTVIRLEPLSPAEATELVRQASGGRIGRRTAERIAAQTGGNPLFIVETTGMLMGSDRAPAARPGGPLPPTVQAVVAARLDQLPADLRELARRASIFLDSFDPTELSFTGPFREAQLSSLEDEEILLKEEQPSRWRFRSQTLRDVAYAGLPKRERMRLHLAVADGLIAAGRPWIADHLELAALASLDLNPDDRSVAERAVDALTEGGERARRRMEAHRAIDRYERALALAGPEEGWGTREARILAGMGEVRYWRGEYAAAAEVLNRAYELGSRTGDAHTLAHALRFLGDIALNFDGDLDKAEELFAKSLAAAEELGDAYSIARSLLFSAWVPWTKDEFAAAEALWHRALDVARSIDDRWVETRALTSLSSVSLEKDDIEAARPAAEEALRVATELDDQFSIAVATVQLARVISDAGDPEGSMALLDRAVAIFSEIGARWELADVLSDRGSRKRELGRLEEAEADLQESLRISQELGERSLVSWTWRALARVSLRRGDRSEAEERLRRAEEERLQSGWREIQPASVDAEGEEPHRPYPAAT